MHRQNSRHDLELEDDLVVDDEVREELTHRLVAIPRRDRDLRAIPDPAERELLRERALVRGIRAARDLTSGAPGSRRR
jgi:hypothetical protein